MTQSHAYGNKGDPVKVINISFQSAQYTVVILGHIYDEPSALNPIYQEVGTAQTDIKMMGNESYATSAVSNNLVLQRCPAYIMHQDLQEI